MAPIQLKRKHDPDAMWRPGYTGPVRYPSLASARGRRSPFLVIVAAVTAVAAVVGGVVLLRSGGGDGVIAVADLPRVAAGATERWSVPVDGLDVTLAAGSADDVVVVAGRAGQGLAGLDATSGAVRWRAALPSATVRSLDVVDGTAVVTVTGKGAARSLAGVVVADGRVVWTRPLSITDVVRSSHGETVVLSGRGADSVDRVQRIDPRTGDVVAAVSGDVTWSASRAQRRDGDRLELLDHASLAPVATVDLRSIGLAGERDVQAAATPAGELVASRAETVLVTHGTIVGQAVTASAPRTTQFGVEILDGRGELVAVQRGNQLAVVSTAGGVVRELWSTRALLLDWHIDGRQSLVAVAPVSGSILSLPPTVLDGRTGRPVWDGPAAVQRSSPMRVFGLNGFVDIRGPSDPPGPLSVVIGYDLDRRERWRQPISIADRILVVDRGVVATASTGTATTVTLYA